jgi:oxygen-independent coproporphyrinogen-3 oxidase
MFGIYLSFPFCAQKCTYCNFASGVFPEGLLEPYLSAVEAEIRSVDFEGQADTLYLGGGTPSLLKPAQLARLIAPLPGKPWREATIEAAPGTITPEKAAGWSALGINRVSLGVQSFVPRVARSAGRRHTPQQVAAETKLLRAAGITNFSVDLIAGLAHETAGTWRESLDWVERLGPSHVSVYMLEVDDESHLGEELRSGGRRYGARFVPSEDQIAEFYLLAIERLRQIGIRQYEISNFALPGCESVHNLKYWNMEPYIGFGADAHSFDGSRRWSNVASAPEYVERSQRGLSVRLAVEPPDDRRRAQERFFTGLRQLEGITPTETELDAFDTAIHGLIGRGWLAWNSQGRLHLTGEGVLFSNEVFEQFV